MADKRSHVVQARREIDNGDRLGSEDAVRAARKRLEAAGVDPDAEKKSAAKARAAAAESEDAEQAQRSAPKGRRRAGPETAG